MARRMTPTDIHIGKRMKIRRISLGLSQVEVAKTLGLTFQQIQKYEEGINRVAGGNLYAISKILKVPINYFFEGIDNEDKEIEEIDRKELNKEVLTIIRLFKNIKDKKKKNLLVDAFKNLLRVIL